MSKVDPANDPIITILQGKVQGSVRSYLPNRPYYSFEGIPYAQPPFDNLRFSEPIPAGCWENVRDCHDCLLKPFQRGREGVLEGTEDCLYLHVFTTNLKPEKKLPVIVWIHGGGFTSGSGNRGEHNPHLMMYTDIVVVNINYRLSVFGFLSLKDPICEVPGNAGLKDQVLALKWIKNNISFFGGDPQNVTLFGENAGSASIQYLSSTAQTKGLFHKAICWSGSFLNPWAFNENTTSYPYQLASDNGYKGPNEDKCVLEFLRNLPAEQLVFDKRYYSENLANGEYFGFVPTIEPYKTPGAIITKPPEELILSAWGNAIPMIVGCSMHSDIIAFRRFDKYDMMSKFKHNPHLFFPKQIRKTVTEEKLNKLYAKVQQLHFHTNADILEFLNYDSFVSMWEGSHRFIKFRQSLATAPTYQFVIDLDAPIFKNFRNIEENATQKHIARVEGMPHLFYFSNRYKFGASDTEFLARGHVHKLFIKFIEIANPNYQCTELVPWEAVSDRNIYKWLKINQHLKFEDMPEDFKAKLIFWVAVNEDPLNINT